jgi:hypothetical protein
MREGIATTLQIVLLVASVLTIIAGQRQFNDGEKMIGICLAAMGTSVLATMLFR